jgi:SAM-dependent methyltransferase
VCPARCWTLTVGADSCCVNSKSAAGRCKERSRVRKPPLTLATCWASRCSSAAALAEVARFLKLDGIFSAAVPNFGSFEARWSREKWFHLDAPRHLNHYTLLILCEQLAAVGLHARRAAFSAAEYDTFSFVQSALNRLGLRHNLLRSSSARLGRAPTLWQTIMTPTLAPFLALLSVPAVVFTSACRTGATITIQARKRNAV